MSEHDTKNIFDKDDIKKEVHEIIVDHIVPAVDKHLKKATHLAHEGEHEIKEDIKESEEEKPLRKRSWFSLIVIAIIGFVAGRISH